MSDANKPSLRIDWFDGTVIEEPKPVTETNDNENETPVEPTNKTPYTERKLMGFKRLLDISHQETSSVLLQLSERSSFWDLLNSDLKNDYVVLIVKILFKLYNYLLVGQKSIMLTKLLYTKLIPSNFFNVLSDYMLNLPSTRIVEKRMNMMFWDDVETFFYNVLGICEGICVLQHEESIEIVGTLLENLQTSVDGLIEEHTERFTESLFNKIADIHCKYQDICRDVSVASGNLLTDVKSDNNDLCNLNIFPTKQDLFGENACDIQPNIINGAYISVQHYLDIQFKLLREDCFGPLREGISKYMENPLKRKHENIRVHPKVRIIKMYVGNNKVGHLVDIAWRERHSRDSFDRKWSKSKQLMFGSLLLFTSDNFNTILCATVLDSNMNLLREGYIAVSFHSPVSNSVFSETFLMVESEVFFEPYHSVLEVLKEFSGSDIPMSRYIVEVQPNTKPPSYLTQDTMYNLPPLNQSSEEISFPVLQLDAWPECQYFGLDESQMEAYKLALTQEFAVIQGPPGTGKSFIGTKVATTLLRNLSLEGTPLLVICHTNHALDQFLETLLGVTKNIVRLGSQSKSEAMEPYTLNNMRMKYKSKYSYLYTNKKMEQENLYKDMTALQDDIEVCEKELICYKTLKAYLKINDKVYELNASNDEDPILKWLFDNGASIDDSIAEDWEQGLEDMKNDDAKDKVDSCFSEKWALREMDSMRNSIKYINDVTDDEDERRNMISKFQGQIDKLNIRLECFKKNFRLYKNKNKQLKEVPDLCSLSSEDRWILYFQAVNSLKEKLTKNMELLQARHARCGVARREAAALRDAGAARRARVLGATTAAAARARPLLRALAAPVVIIEEAAEVLEAHIVASLTHYCQHVILIGDHKQLRPTAAHYRLARDYNIEISLFERMIRNGVHARTLTTQRRMRPSFVDLIVPAVYERLDSHPNVSGYASVRGVAKDLYFLSHKYMEDEEMDDSWSHTNRFEAKWCVALANYLRKKQYAAEDVTILATYTGQANLIKELSKGYETVRNCKITVVDNYQGEESRIVILSLVRSNRDGKIGFLAAQNRICVALSRAKEGFYIFGNMVMLMTASRIWRSVNEKLIHHDAIGTTMPLRCSLHHDNIMRVDKAEDLDRCLIGGCLEICENNLNET